MTAAGRYTVQKNMKGSGDGSNPAYALVQATNGKLYGVGVASVAQNASASNTIFSITTTGTFTTLYTFTGGGEGGFPPSPLGQHPERPPLRHTHTGGGRGRRRNPPRRASQPLDFPVLYRAPSLPPPLTP